jgi:uncharacterized damage-inducible protein DinB
MESQKYPIGRFEVPSEMDTQTIQKWIHDISILPSELKDKVAALTEDELNVTYRDGGWSIRQVIHHLADSHMNSFIRFKLTLTEELPTVKTYDESAWATQIDSLGTVTPSLQIIEGLHIRWVSLLTSLSEQELSKEFNHPELGRISLYKTLALYSWHCRHHLAHIQLALNKIK